MRIKYLIKMLEKYPKNATIYISDEYGIDKDIVNVFRIAENEKGRISHVGIAFDGYIETDT